MQYFQVAHAHLTGQVVAHIPSQVSQVALSSQVAHISGSRNKTPCAQVCTRQVADFFFLCLGGVGHISGVSVPVSAAGRNAAATAVRLLSVTNPQANDLCCKLPLGRFDKEKTSVSGPNSM